MHTAEIDHPTDVNAPPNPSQTGRYWIDLTIPEGWKAELT